MKTWISSFLKWAKEEPVAVAEQIRILLLGVLAVFQITVGEEVITAIGAAILAILSIYASKTVRSRVTPVVKLEKNV